MTPELERATIAWEGRLILQIKRLADVNARLMKALAFGRMDSDIVGSYYDLRDIATQLESVAEEGRKLEARVP